MLRQDDHAAALAVDVPDQPFFGRRGILIEFVKGRAVDVIDNRNSLSCCHKDEGKLAVEARSEGRMNMNKFRRVLLEDLPELSVRLQRFFKFILLRAVAVGLHIGDAEILFQTTPVIPGGDSGNAAVHHRIRHNHTDVMHHLAPLCPRTTTIVCRRILKSSVSDQLSMYSRSRRTTSSKSDMSLRPLTCHMPVRPGVIDRRLR